MHDGFIPFHRPSIGKEDGPATKKFECEFAEYIGCKHAVAVNSCTAALQLALDAIGIQAADEVLVPSYTFTATAAVVAHSGARPVLCDSVPGGFNMDPEDAERRITPKTRAIIPVHIAGEPCDMARLASLAERHNLHVVEDAAHALPASYRGRRIGSLSELTAFSFYATKTMTTGEGGMLTTDNDEHAKRAAMMRLHGISGDAWKRYSRQGSWYYEVMDAGYKLNLCDILSALGSAQLKKCDLFRERRRTIAEIYNHSFSEVEEVQTPPAAERESEHSWHLFILRLRPDLLSLSRNECIEELRGLGIGTSVHFIPLHLHPFYAQQYRYQRNDFPAAEDAYSRCLSLPIYPGLTEAEIERVIQGVKQIVQKNRTRGMVAA